MLAGALQMPWNQVLLYQAKVPALIIGSFGGVRKAVGPPPLPVHSMKQPGRSVRQLPGGLTQPGISHLAQLIMAKIIILAAMFVQDMLGPIRPGSSPGLLVNRAGLF